MSMPSSSGPQSISCSRSGSSIHSIRSLSAAVGGLREAARTLWPAAANAQMTTDPMNPDEPVTSTRNDILQPDLHCDRTPLSASTGPMQEFHSDVNNRSGGPQHL